MKTPSLQVVYKVSEPTRRLPREQEECQRQMHVHFQGKSVRGDEKKREERRGNRIGRKKKKRTTTNLMLIYRHESPGSQLKTGDVITIKGTMIDDWHSDKHSPRGRGLS